MMTMLQRMDEHIVVLSNSWLIDPNVLRALMLVETAGGEGLQDGRPVIRLEVNKFWLGVPKALRSKVDARFRVDGPRPWEGHRWLDSQGRWASMHRGQDMEWEALLCARDIHESAAIQATSWGAGQVMGNHYQVLGYASPTAMAVGMKCERHQIYGIMAYLVHFGAVPAIQRGDWEDIARRYNGTGDWQMYADRMEKAYQKLAG